ncbi:MAG: Fe-S cluster assembly protein SufD [Elusimicrobia bacterium]|nr:Fe-S cluster assembly protein SufD [Elusimicrobiota bacterium]
MSAPALTSTLAWDAFKASVLPAPTTETWRRFPREVFAFERLRREDASAMTGLGRPVPAGVEVTTLEEALKARPELAARVFNLSAGDDFRRLETANLALWRGGAFVRVPAGVKVAEPIHLEFVHDPTQPYAFPRALVMIEDGAEAVVVEEHRSPASDLKPVSAAFSSLRLGAGAKARYVYVQDLSKGSSHFWRQDASLGRAAVLEHSSVMVGGSRVKTELSVALEGTLAHSTLRGVLLGRADHVSDARTTQHHKAAKTRSDLDFRAALRDKARSLYTGLLRIERDAPDCEAYQTNKNLLLSDRARADSTPVLEILPDRVACKHAATSGPLEEPELFYLQTRGLDRAEAERTLVLAFFQALLDTVPVDSLRARLEALVAREAL